MELTRINELRTELEAERVSYEEIIEIQGAFDRLAFKTLRDLPENASLGDMLDELEDVAKGAPLT